MNSQQEVERGKVGMEPIMVGIDPNKPRVNIRTNGTNIPVVLNGLNILNKMPDVEEISTKEIVAVFGDDGYDIAANLFFWDDGGMNDIEMPSVDDWVANFGMDRVLKIFVREHTDLMQYVKSIRYYGYYGMRKHEEKETGVTGKDDSAGVGARRMWLLWPWTLK